MSDRTAVRVTFAVVAAAGVCLGAVAIRVAVWMFERIDGGLDYP